MVFSRKDDRLKSMEEILKNAPADSSHVSISGVYYFINCGDAMQYHEPAERWIESSGIRHLCRSLDDIRTQIQLMEQNEKLEAEVAELESDVIGERLRIGKQKEVIESKHKRITELEREAGEQSAVACAMYNEAIRVGMCSEFMKVNFACATDFLSKLKLEQQVEALTDLHDFFLNEQWDFHGDDVAFVEIALKLDKRINQLRNSAKGES